MRILQDQKKNPVEIPHRSNCPPQGMMHTDQMPGAAGGREWAGDVECTGALKMDPTKPDTQS